MIQSNRLPALAVDEEGVLISGGVAVATGGLSVLAKAAWDRLSRSGNPCKTAHEEAVEALGSEFPAIEALPSYIRVKRMVEMNRAAIAKGASYIRELA